MLQLDLIPPIPLSDIMTIEDLENIKTLRKAIDNSIKAYKSIDYEILSQNNISDVKVTSSTKNDVIFKKLAEIEDHKANLEYYIAQKTEELECYILKAVSIINQIDSPDQQDILMLRYIDCLSWNDICIKRDRYDVSNQMKLRQRAQKSFIEVQTKDK